MSKYYIHMNTHSTRANLKFTVLQNNFYNSFTSIVIEYIYI